MWQLCLEFWQDEKGVVVASELTIIGTICVLGLVVGLSELSNAVNHELVDLAMAVNSLNQSYQTSGTGWNNNHHRGSSFQDSNPHQNQEQLTEVYPAGEGNG